ncbi:MAG: hypothetical protein WCP18_04110 [bacterium]
MADQEKADLEILKQQKEEMAQTMSFLPQRIRAEIETLVRQKMADIIDTSKNEKFVSRQKTFESMGDMEDSMAELGINSGDIENAGDEMEDIFKGEIYTAITNASSGSNPLSKMENTINSFLSLKKAGNKTGSDVREMIKDTLEKSANSSSTPLATRIILKKALSNLGL